MGKKNFFRGRIPEIIDQIENTILGKIQIDNKPTDKRQPPKKSREPKSEIGAMREEEIREFLGKKQLPQTNFDPQKTINQREAAARADQQEKNEEEFGHHLSDPRYENLNNLPHQEKMNKDISSYKPDRARQPHNKGHKDDFDPQKIRESTKENQNFANTKPWDELEEKLKQNRPNKDQASEQTFRKENDQAA